MVLKIYVAIWLVILSFFSYEYAALNGATLPSVFKSWEAEGALSFKVTPEPGRTLSLYLGWAGLILMILMNVYSLRKRTSWLDGLGRLSAYLNFHVFCGLVGPTFIVFHCNFKVRGLVAVSFWSMVISFLSGIVGRYFYLQIAMKKNDYQQLSDKWVERLKRFLARDAIEFNEREHRRYLQQALTLAGAPPKNVSLNLAEALWQSLMGDLRLMMKRPAIPEGWPENSALILKEYAQSFRRATTLESFRKLMGYWHAFHFPFAIFMYAAAAIHVAAAYVFASGAG